MSVSGPYNDTPFQIDYEGAQIELTFTKTTPDTATITWNIPEPFVGCTDDSGAYNGIVITLDNKSVENSQRPVNGTFYTADPTASGDLHAGDRIGDAIVVGAFYDDDLTTSLIVSDIEPSTAYYFSAYAVDKRGRYHRAGSHAYALEWSKETKDRDFPAYQEFRVLGPVNKKVNITTFTEPDTTMLHSQWTGLSTERNYSITVSTDVLPETEVVIAGAAAQNYERFVAEFNDQLALAIAPVLNAGAPNAGSFYIDAPNQKAYVWTGSAYNQADVTFNASEPNGVSDGDFWLDLDTDVLQRRVGGAWEAQSYLRYYKQYNNLSGSDYWIDGDVAMQWEGATWCKRPLTNSPIDPSLARTPSTGEFWFNTKDGVMYTWSDEGACWKSTEIIFHSEDPSAPSVGTLWYNYDAKKLFIFDGSDWVEQTATYAELPPKTASDGQIWVDVKNEVVKIYNFSLREWNKADVIYWHADPRNRKSCDKWWKSSNGFDQIFVWDFINSVWVEHPSFTQGEIDPREVVLAVGHVWNRTDGHYFKWDGMTWTEITAIELSHDPRTPVIGEILRTADEWLIWSGTSWDEINVHLNDDDPANLPIGDMWFDSSVRQLKQLTAVGWTSVPYSIKPQVPKAGERYFDTLTNKLKEWINGRWQNAILPLRATINELNNLMFIGSTLGSNGWVKITPDEQFRADIKPYFVSGGPVVGHDAVSAVPSYKADGVGTDGSVDERREVITAILAELGLGGVNVELTKVQLERAVDSALETLRQKSSAGYKRGFMFMDVVPESQNYVLSNKNEGYNRIVTVNGAFRMSGGRVGGYAHNDPFDQSMIQQLYYAGSFDLLSYHLLSSYNELLNEMFAKHLNFSWNERTRVLMFHQYMRFKERILLDVMVERSEQDLLTDRYTRPWLIKFATAKSMMMLAQIRGKFASLPGAGGGVSLNASDLATQAQTYIDECMAEIEEYVVNTLEDVGGGAAFILG